MSTALFPTTCVFQNKYIELEIGPDGRLLLLVNRHTGHNYAGGGYLWRLCLQDGDEFDVEATAAGLTPEIVLEGGNRASLRYTGLQRDGQPLAMSVEISVELCGDEIHWSIRLKNNEPKLVVRECHFPLLGNAQIQTVPTLITSSNGGERIADLRHRLTSQWKGYVTSDHLFSAFTVHYPSPAATNCFVLAGQTEGLYFGCHQYPVESTLHQFRLYPGEKIEAGFVRFPHLAVGQEWESDVYVVAAYQGTWHVAARKYRTWADTWFQKPRPPEWVRRLNGWQRLIMQHQYGLRHYKYEQMPRIRTEGEAAGINSLFMFGWQKGGHDNNYPDYEPDPRLGTEKEMRHGIEDFNRHGGHVLLYANGRLIDTTSEFYKTTGKKISVKDFHGNEVRENYKFQGAGNFTLTAARTFVMACPSSPEWYAILQGLADKAFAWKCHSLFLDQMGYGEYPCCDPTHNHPPLWRGIIQAKAEILRRLHDYMRSLDPDFALGIEWPSDVTAQYVDYVHSITGADAFLDWFRYTFPEVILSDRDIRDDTDVERRVNLAVAKGLRSDVEIYRCRSTIAATPNYSAWLGQVNRLRQKHADLLLEGTYIDTEGFSLDNADVTARAFRQRDQLGIVVTQSHSEEVAASIEVSGYQLESWDSVGNPVPLSSGERGRRVRLTLPCHALVLLRWKKVK
ncbi:MAG: hypothetical protein B9S32_00950 [Verrucomicrobia bacterium Tous-C9LFEB]|nr:MAG: hypothetical protein B9S32_00950 [Verrucomicrobia bacterium Tous-C9LFEB]